MKAWLSDLAGRTKDLVDEVSSADLVVMVASAGTKASAAGVIAEACGRALAPRRRATWACGRARAPRAARRAPRAAPAGKTGVTPRLLALTASIHSTYPM